jgi:hypothetical protein
MSGSWSEVRIAVSSAYMPMRVFSEEGMSAVNRMYKKWGWRIRWRIIYSTAIK